MVRLPPKRGGKVVGNPGPKCGKMARTYGAMHPIESSPSVGDSRTLDRRHALLSATARCVRASRPARSPAAATLGSLAPSRMRRLRHAAPRVRTPPPH
jgi:hypothetical protein